MLNYYAGFNCHYFHPNRENNDSIIQDAEYREDINKSIDEQRHEIAMKCVMLGIYKDVYEAKESSR
jgi:hypothetical protein